MNAIVPQSGLAEAIKAVSDLTPKAQQVSLSISGLGKGLPASIPVLLNPKDGTITSLKNAIEGYRIEPERRKGTAKVLTLQSFTDLVNRHKDEHSVIFARTAWPTPQLTAVIDYHKTDHEARWGQHRVEYDFPVTAEFKVWHKNDGKPMEQVEFAHFLEDRVEELSSPFDTERTIYEGLFRERLATPTEVLALSRELEVLVGAKVKQGVRLASGERAVEFTTEHTTAKGKPVDIPGVFIIQVKVFEDGEPVRIPARLRYRIVDGGITWFYQMYRWENFLRERIREDLDIAKRDTSLPAFEGAAET